MSSSKKLDLKRDFAAGVYLFETQNLIPLPTPLHTVYVHTVYLLTHRREGGGGVLNQRDGQRTTVHKAGSKYQHG